MSNLVYVNLKITKGQNGEFLKGYRKDTNENYFLFTNKEVDPVSGEENIVSRKLTKAAKVPQGAERGKFQDVGYLDVETTEYGKSLVCKGHTIKKNQHFDQGQEIEGVMYKTNREGELLTFPSGDYIPMEEMTLIINPAELAGAQVAANDDIPF